MSGGRFAPEPGPELVVFGSLTIDNVMRADGEVLPQSFGGNCLYAALGARLWNDRVGIVSRYGAGYNQAVLLELKRLGVDIRGVRKVRGPHLRNVAFRYRADGGRSRTFPPEALQALAPKDRARFVDSSTLPDAHATHRQFAPDRSDLPRSWRASMRGVHFATAPLVKLLDVASAIHAMRIPRPLFLADSLWLDRAEPGQGEVIAALLKMAFAVLPSEQDLENFRPGAPYDETAAALLAAGASAMVLKRGAAGCRVFGPERGAAIDVPASPVRAVDPTGAGDSFCGGLLAGLLHTGDLLQAAHYGVVSASFCVEAPGPSGLMTATRQAATERIAALSRRTSVQLDPLPRGMVS